MLFEKYQYNSRDIVKRGYSQNCIASDENGQQFWVKWILGIEKNETKAKILSDKLRHLQKARHSALPPIIEYGFDNEISAYAIVYEFLEDARPFETSFWEFNTQTALSGLIDLADCLQELHTKFKINHGDVHPGNILIDKNGQFYLIDFGLADITKTLSQEKNLEIFASSFAAPEKLNKLHAGGFPYQSDIYSLGKVLEWFFNEKQETIPEEYNLILQKLLLNTPADRPQWQDVLSFLRKLANASQTESVWVSFRAGHENEIIELLQNNTPIFDLAPKPGLNFLADVILGSFICEGVLWIKDEKKLLFNGINYLSSIDSKIAERKIREGKKLPFKFKFDTNNPNKKADLTPYFQKWFELKENNVSIQRNRRAVREELGFYTELLNEELQVISSKALRLQYSSYVINGNEITFRVTENEKFSSIGFLQKHIEEGNDVNSDGFEYIISATAEKKQNKEPVEFAGKPYDYLPEEKLFKIKDCERLKIENIPVAGFIFENTAKVEEEKRRQLDAIRKVEKNEVQNPDLIYYLFKPNELPPSFSDYAPLEKVWQKDEKNIPFQYSDNQTKAIRNALNKTPLSIIQGPPGTGKTTVITEIVFQILSAKPEAKILITSQTNNAVDQVLENLLKNDIPILRLSGITAPRVPIIRKHTIDRKLEGWKQQVRETAERNFKKHINSFKQNLQKSNSFETTIFEILNEITDWNKAKDKIEQIVSRILNLKELHVLPKTKSEAIQFIDNVLKTNIGEFVKRQELHRDWIVTINSLDEKSALNQKLVDSIRVIGATCNHIAAKKYNKYHFEFDYVIMDESGKATTAEALVPIITGKNLIFVGDHRQLRPMLTATREVEGWLREKFKKESDELENWDDYFNRPSLFEQVITQIEPDYKAQLTECRRSSEQQVLLTSKCFYEPEGDEPIIPVKRDISKEHNLPLPIESSIFFIDIGSHSRNEFDEGKSSFNRHSAQLISEILSLLNQHQKIKEYSFGIITGYTAQYRELKKKIDEKIYLKKIENIWKWSKIEDKLTVSVVDRFQGLERDIVIVDLVKSGAGLNLGFLEVPNRINVALSRQKKLLIIVGDYHGIINAPTKRLNGKKAALQYYLERIKPEWIINSSNIKGLFQKFEHSKIDDSDNSDLEQTISSEIKEILTLNKAEFNKSAEQSNITWLSNEKENPSRAVLELSTKAVKLLINTNQQKLREGDFNFNECFVRYSERTETGAGVDKSNNLDIIYFRQKVLPSIIKFVEIAKSCNIDVMHTVATAVYRNAINKEEILRVIKDATGLNVKILSKTEESTTTLWAYIFTTKNKDSFLSANRILMLDQGGGSTELSFFEKQKLVFAHSFDIGSTILKEKFFKQSTISIRNALNETDAFAINFISRELHEHVDYAHENIEYSVGVGRALTIATGEKSNERQHDFKLTKNRINQVINSFGNEICDYKTMENLKKNAKNDWVENKIVTRLGLPIILEIMNHFQIDSLYVNGTGLWYGVFFKEFHKIS